LAINKAYTAAVALMDTLAFADRDKARGRMPDEDERLARIGLEATREKRDERLRV
jgi:hypothetical protein